MTEGFDPIAPTSPTTADIESDSSTEIDSSGVDLSYSREQDDGSPTERAAVELAARTKTRVETVTQAPEATEEDDEDGTDRTAEQRARDEQGRFAKAQAAEPAKPKDRGERRVQTLRARIDAETRALTTARQQRESEERELARIRAEKQTLTGTKEPAPKSATEAKDNLGAAPDWDAFAAEGKTWKDYEQARDEYLLNKAEARALAKLEATRADEKAAAEKAKAAETETQARKAYEQKFVTARTKHQDFDQVLKAADDAGLEMHDFIGLAVRHVPAGADLLYTLSRPEYHDAVDALSDFFDGTPAEKTFPLMDALEATEDPARLLLACVDPTTKADVEAALRLSRPAALVALGRIEERLTARANGSQPKAPVIVAAPPPSHRAGSHSAGASRASSADSESVDDYVRSRQKQLYDARRQRTA
jgi:hypothetical protein